jgi:hypothetical protein
MGLETRVSLPPNRKAILAFKVKTVGDPTKASLVEYEPADGVELDSEDDWASARTAWLNTNPLTSRIIAIGTRAHHADGRVIDKTFSCARSFHDEGEARMLQQFMDYLDTFHEVATWNGKAYCLPTLRTRCMLLGVKGNIARFNTRPWDMYPNSSVADMLRELLPGGPKRLMTLRNAALALGAPEDCVPPKVKMQELVDANDAKAIHQAAQRSANAIGFLFDRFFTTEEAAPVFRPPVIV